MLPGKSHFHSTELITSVKFSADTAILLSQNTELFVPVPVPDLLMPPLHMFFFSVFWKWCSHTILNWNWRSKWLFTFHSAFCQSVSVGGYILFILCVDSTCSVHVWWFVIISLHYYYFYFFLHWRKWLYIIITLIFLIQEAWMWVKATIKKCVLLFHQHCTKFGLI